MFALGASGVETLASRRMGFLDRFRRGPSGEDVEVTAGGSRVHRHTQPVDGDLAAGDHELIEAVSEHIEQHIGEPETVLHQLISMHVHVDIHVVPPSDERPCITLVTTGMSERAMNAPRPEVSRAELVMILPPDWPLGQDAMGDERHYWPFRLLQQLAVLPHEYDTWLWHGHTVPNGDPPAPYADGAGFCGAVLLPLALCDEAFDELQVGEHTVTFLGVYPLYEDEMQLKLDQGAEELADRFEAARVSEALEPGRPSVA